MSAYVPQVGDRVTHESWMPGAAATVLHVDGHDVMVRYGNGRAAVHSIHDSWTKVPTFPERWMNVYPDYVGDEHESADVARQCGDDHIGVIHLHPDGTLTMEAP